MCIIHNAAANGSDYIEVSMDLVFTAGSSNGAVQCIDVVIIDSPSMEENETFTVTLSSVVALGNNVTTVNITDTDSMYICL